MEFRRSFKPLSTNSSLRTVPSVSPLLASPSKTAGNWDKGFPRPFKSVAKALPGLNYNTVGVKPFKNNIFTVAKNVCSQISAHNWQRRYLTCYIATITALGVVTIHPRVNCVIAEDLIPVTVSQAWVWSYHGPIRAPSWNGKFFRGFFCNLHNISIYNVWYVQYVI